MKILLDTHILIWFLEDNKRLSSKLSELIVNPINLIYFSSVSLAEMALKASKNRLIYPDDILNICYEQGFEELALLSKHSLVLRDLPLIHNDPFDRLLVAQALSEDIFLMSADQIFIQYNIKLIK